MSNYPIVTNKYTPKAVFSGNIINDIYTYEIDPRNDQTFDVVIKKDKKFVELEKPLEMSTLAGNAIKVVGKATIYGFDYLGQAIKETIDGSASGGAVGNVACWKYINKVELDAVATADTTIKISNSFSKCSLPYKTLASLSAIKTTDVGVSKVTLTITAPDVTKNGGSTFNTRGYVAITSVDGKYSLVLIADHSTVIVDDEEVGGLYGNPIYI